MRSGLAVHLEKASIKCLTNSISIARTFSGKGSNLELRFSFLFFFSSLVWIWDQNLEPEAQIQKYNSNRKLLNQNNKKPNLKINKASLVKMGCLWWAAWIESVPFNLHFHWSFPLKYCSERPVTLNCLFRNNPVTSYYTLVKISFLAMQRDKYIGFCPSKALRSRLELGTGRKEGQEENHWVPFIYFENRKSWQGGGSSFAPQK